MTQGFRMTVALLAILVTAGKVEAQGWRVIDGGHHHVSGRQVATPGVVSQVVPAPAASVAPPSLFARRAAPGGLVETAARRFNPFAAPSRAGDVTFAPSPYRQPPQAVRGQVMRPPFGGPGYRIVEPAAGHGLPTTGPIPGLDCPSCPK